MILGQSSPGQMAVTASAGRATLDDMFCRSVARHPDAIALADPPNRETFTDGPPQCVTYTEADRMIDAIAGKLRRLGLHTDHIIGVQMPNTVEGVLTLLGVIRAGMIAAPLPLLWRGAEAVAALSRIGAKALVTCRRIGATDHCELAMTIAAETFPIRHVCAFGRDLPDGVVALDEVLADEPGPAAAVERAANPAAHLALITWEMSAGGVVPVARNHVELLAASLAIVLEGRIEPRAAMVSTLGISSFAGLATGVLPWLMVGGTLCLHHPFDPAGFAGQLAEHACRTAVVPGPLAFRFAESGMLPRANGLHTVLAVWRAPERLNASPDWRDETNLVDVQVFGETGLIAARRTALGRPAPTPLGPVTAPRGMPGAVLVAELARTEAGTLALRGPMVPPFPYPPGAERGDAPCLRPDADFYVDTGYPCRIERDSAMVVTAPPAGLVGVGFYRFALGELQRLVGEVDATSTLAALPDALTGQRLAGHAENCDAVRAELARRGANPLIAGAFRDRRAADRSAAA